MPVPASILILLAAGIGAAYLITKPKPVTPSEPPQVTVQITPVVEKKEIVRERIVVTPTPPPLKPEPKPVLLQKPEPFVIFHMPQRKLDVFNATC